MVCHTVPLAKRGQLTAKNTQPRRIIFVPISYLNSFSTQARIQTAQARVSFLCHPFHSQPVGLGAWMGNWVMMIPIFLRKALTFPLTQQEDADSKRWKIREGLLRVFLMCFLNVRNRTEEKETYWEDEKKTENRLQEKKHLRSDYVDITPLKHARFWCHPKGMSLYIILY